MNKQSKTEMLMSSLTGFLAVYQKSCASVPLSVKLVNESGAHLTGRIVFVKFLPGTQKGPYRC